MVLSNYFFLIIIINLLKFLVTTINYINKQ